MSLWRALYKETKVGMLGLEQYLICNKKNNPHKTIRKKTHKNKLIKR